MSDRDDGQIKFMLFNVVTRRLLPQRWSTGSILNAEFQAENVGEGEDQGSLDYVLGHWDADTHYVNGNGEVRFIGNRKPVPPRAPETVPISADTVDDEITRRVEQRYSLVDQINALRGNGEVDFAWIDAVRDAGRALKAPTPIPPDFTDDRHWPSNT